MLERSSYIREIVQRPFLKWAGSKFALAGRIKAALPSGARLVEPFVGSGAVFLNTDFEEYLLADANRDLINLYQTVAAAGEAFLDQGRALFSSETNTQARFYELREEFNSRADDERKSAIFIYLNRHCFNGLCRYNRAGKFNTPFGRYKQPRFPEQELRAFAEKSKRALFMHADFEATFISTRAGDVIYCDPPYIPLSTTASFTSYSVNDFGIREQRQLAMHAEQAASDGIPVLISNHDTSLSRELYEHAAIQSFDVQRFISAKTSHRTRAPELLALFGAGFHEPLESLAAKAEGGLPFFDADSARFGFDAK